MCIASCFFPLSNFEPRWENMLFRGGAVQAGSRGRGAAPHGCCSACGQLCCVQPLGCILHGCKPCAHPAQRLKKEPRAETEMPVVYQTGEPYSEPWRDTWPSVADDSEQDVAAIFATLARSSGGINVRWAVTRGCLWPIIKRIG